jgi:hypothetical protein
MAQKVKGIMLLGPGPTASLNRQSSVTAFGLLCFGGSFEMLWTIFVILLILWLLGLVSSYTLGGYIHILLVVALVVLIFNLVTGRRGAV